MNQYSSLPSIFTTILNKQRSNVAKLLVVNEMSNEKLLKEILEVRIAERNRLFAENRLLKDEILQLNIAQTKNDVLIEDMDREFAEIWDQNCLLEDIVRKKNTELAQLTGIEESYEALIREADRLKDELSRLKKTNEILVTKVIVKKICTMLFFYY